MLTILKEMNIEPSLYVFTMYINGYVSPVDFDGTKVYNRINLNQKGALKSPVYYLTQNDVVYVEPNKSGKTASSLDQRASIAVSIISVLITSTVVLLTRN